ncbi:amino acid adenylation domain-containing protein [Mycetohabitans rhizoxinica]|uniref:Amino acid adenylation domain-containing protein n=1 Tax=Mycetohabitans rhizoxinica TaxID=412963 RepID=A0ABZ2PT57_9BURK
MSDSITSSMHPLTTGQTAIWLAQQLRPDSPVYNIGQYTSIEGAIDPAVFEAAMRQVVDEVDSLRLQFVESNEGIRQYVGSPEWSFPLVDLSAEADPQAAADAWMRADYEQPVDILKGPLFNYALLKVAPDRVLWYQRCHHIVMDGFGFFLIAQRVAHLYSAMCEGTELEPCPFGSVHQLFESDVQYSASAQWKRDEAYWLKRCADWSSPATLASRSAPPLQHRLRQTIYFSAQSIERYANDANRLAQLITAAMAAYFYRLTSVEDVVLGFPVTARFGADRNTPGMMSNVLPVRIAVQPDMNLSSLMQHAAQEIQRGFRYQRYPNEALRRKLGLMPDQRLLGTMVNVMPFDYDLKFGGCKSINYNLLNGPVEDLMVAVYTLPGSHQLRIDFNANPACYTKDELVAHQRRFIQFLETLVADPARPIRDIELLDAAERHVLLVERNTTQCDYPADLCVHQMVEAQVARAPDATALVYNAQTFSYAQLNKQANRLAHRLVELGVKPDTRVAICVERSPAMVVGLLAILKAGGAYVPLNPAYPSERLAHILADAEPAIVLADTAGRAALGETMLASRTVLDPNVPSQCADTNPSVAQLTARHLMYVIYTSGSSGAPKGVQNEHQALVNRLIWMQQAYQLTPADRVLQKTPFDFDVSVWEFFWTLMSGATLVVAAPDAHRDTAALTDLIIRQRITTVHFVPSMLEPFLRSEGVQYCTSLKRLFCSGEALPGASVQLCRALLPDTQLYNLYGPTEAAIDVTAWCCPADYAEETVPIGRPIANTCIYLLDRHGHLVPSGAVGELYIGGAGVARGYLNRPELTAACFLSDPFSTVPNARMYKTGDFARYLPDGNLEFMGRSDHQVKVRGYRVELSEIEAVLQRHPDVAQAIVAIRDDRQGHKQLIGYVVADPQGKNKLDAAGLRQHVAHHLPEYMVPVAVVLLDALPLTPSGKVDRRALPEPEVVSSYSRTPRSPQEQKLAELFAEVLDVQQVGIDDNFFDLGGTSLLAMRLVSRIRTALDVEFTIRTLFENLTVASLAQRLTQNTAVRPPLRPQQRPEPLPLSFAQSRLWFIQQLNGPSAIYNIPVALRLSGELNVDALQTAFHDLLARHESLRTGFTEVDGVPAQHIFAQEDIHFLLEVVKVTEQTLPDALKQAAARPFDLHEGIPLRAALFRLDAQEHVLLVTLHHIAGDGWSWTPFGRDLSKAYASRLVGEAPDWEPLPVQYADYTLWQRNLLSCEDKADSLIAQQLEYWRQALAGLPERLMLPTDRPHPPVASHKGACLSFHIDANLHRQLLVLAREQQASLFMVLHAALATLLTRMGSGNDIAVGSPIAGRTDEALNDLVGFFVNTLVLRTNTSGNPHFRALLQQVRETCLAAYSCQDLQFERLVEVLNPARSSAHHPLFQVSLTMYNNALPQFNLAGLHIEEEKVELLVTKLDISFHFDETPNENGINAIVQYATDLFDRKTIEQLTKRFVRLLESVTQEPDQPIGNIRLLDDAERRKLLIEWNDTIRPIRETTLPALFEDQVAKTPNAIALVFNGQSVSYAELDIRANRLAHFLIAKGVGPEDVVAIAMPRSPSMVIAMLAVLKAGAAYLPLDPHHSAERFFITLSDAQPVAMLRFGQANQTVANNLLVLQLDDLDLQAALETCPNVAPTDRDRISPLNPRHPAYVIYTSGSTGTPKGVVVTHHSLVNYIDSIQSWVSEHANMVWISNVSADLGNTSLYGAIFSGKKLTIVRDEEILDPKFISENYLEDESVFKITPSHLSSLIKSMPNKGDNSKRTFFLGGERIDGELVAGIRLNWRNSRIINHYGPTEATIGMLVGELPHEISLESTPFLPLGRPISNTQAYVLDNELQPVPVGVAGELYIAGSSLARGYLDRPGLTSERFVADPFGPLGSRMYRSGDLMKWRSDGSLDFLGRVDDQVKIRGFRIELREIEAVLRRNPAVRQVAVITRDDHSGSQQLVSYVVPKGDGTSIDPVLLRRQIAQQLPDYMVPAAIVLLDALPLTPNGKLDRKALPIPSFTSERYRAPDTLQEQALATLFAKALNLPHVGIDDSFFDLGGHSLSAVQLTLKIQKVFNVNVPVRMLFEADTVAKLAERIESDALATSQSADSDGTEQLMRADAILAEDICKKTISNDSHGTWENVLLTGATGFVGRYILLELLRQTNANVICLVNEKDKKEAMKRVVSALKETQRQDLDISRISTICGDLSKKDFGLSHQEIEYLSDKVDAILHNGAAVNHFFSYHELRQANVLATEALIRLSATGRNKSFHYVSTVSVMPRAKTGTFTEISDTSIMPIANGYVQSKWVGEQLTSAAAMRGIPSSIYRLGRITADSQTGYCNMKDSVYRIICAIKTLGLSFNTNKLFFQTPVDCAAQAIVKLATRQDKSYQVAHIMNNQSLKLNDFVCEIDKKENCSIKNVDFNEWLARLKERADETLDENLMSLLSIMDKNTLEDKKRDPLENSESLISISAEDTIKRLRELGFEYPSVENDYIESIIDFLMKQEAKIMLEGDVVVRK